MKKLNHLLFAALAAILSLSGCDDDCYQAEVFRPNQFTWDGTTRSVSKFEKSYSAGDDVPYYMCGLRDANGQNSVHFVVCTGGLDMTGTYDVFAAGGPVANGFVIFNVRIDGSDVIGEGTQSGKIVILQEGDTFTIEIDLTIGGKKLTGYFHGTSSPMIT